MQIVGIRRAYRVVREEAFGVIYFRDGRYEVCWSLRAVSRLTGMSYYRLREVFRDFREYYGRDYWIFRMGVMEN